MLTLRTDSVLGIRGLDHPKTVLGCRLRGFSVLTDAPRRDRSNCPLFAPIPGLLLVWIGPSLGAVFAVLVAVCVAVADDLVSDCSKVGFSWSRRSLGNVDGPFRWDVVVDGTAVRVKAV